MTDQALVEVTRLFERGVQIERAVDAEVLRITRQLSLVERLVRETEQKMQAVRELLFPPRAHGRRKQGGSHDSTIRVHLPRHLSRRDMRPPCRSRRHSVPRLRLPPQTDG